MAKRELGKAVSCNQSWYTISRKGSRINGGGDKKTEKIDSQKIFSERRLKTKKDAKDTPSTGTSQAARRVDRLVIGAGDGASRWKSHEKGGG